MVIFVKVRIREQNYVIQEIILINENLRRMWKTVIVL
jgi:hypothetical protein